MDDNLKIISSVELDFDSAKKQFAEFQKSIEKENFTITVDLKSNIDTQLEGIKKQIDGLSAPIDRNTKAFGEQGEQIKKAANETSNFANNVNDTGRAIKSAEAATKSWGASIKRMVIYWFSYRLAIGTLMHSLDILRNIDSSLTELSKVVDITRRDFQQLGIEALNAASVWGRTAADFLDASTSFAKAGFENYQQMAELSLITQAAGDLNEQLASSYLIASDKAFSFGGNVERLTALLDAQNQVSNRHAITLEFLASATRISGNIFMQAGQTTQEMTAALTAMGVATQRSGSEVGRAARTITLRLQQVRQAFDGLDFELDGEIINAEAMSNASRALSRLGFDVVRVAEDGTETFATMTEVATFLAQALDDGAVSATNLRQILDALAGQRQSEMLLALINNQDEFNRAMENYANAAGSAMEEAQKQAESWQGRTAALSNEWGAFLARSMDVSKVAITIIDSVGFLIRSLYDLNTVLVLIGAWIAAFNYQKLIAGFKGIGTSVQTAGGGIKGFVQLLTQKKQAMAMAESQNISLSAAYQKLGFAAGATKLAVSALMAAITIGIMVYNNHRRVQEENRQAALSLADAYRSQLSNFDDLMARLNDESNTRRDLIEIMRNHNDRYSEELLALEDVNDVRERSIELMAEEKRLRAQETMRELGSQYSDARDFLGSSLLGGDYNQILEALGLGDPNRELVWLFDDMSDFETPERALAALAETLDYFNDKQREGIELTNAEIRTRQLAEDGYSRLKSQIEDATRIIEAYTAAQSVLDGTHIPAVEDEEEVMSRFERERQILQDEYDERILTTAEFYEELQALEERYRAQGLALLEEEAERRRQMTQDMLRETFEKLQAYRLY